jgi:hypothetical protein
MSLRRITLISCLLLGSAPFSHPQSYWPAPHKKTIQVRLIAVKTALPRTSFFANDEVLIAGQN